MIGDDYIIDRYKLKNSLNKWKFLALVFLFISIFTIFYHRSDSVSKIKPNYIANIEISGMILQNQEMIKSLNKLANDSNVKAVLVNINSTGGTGVGGESLYRELRRIAKNKPVVASIGEIGASAGYMIALGTDRIFAYDISLVGSIGVMIMNFEINELAKKHGINLELIKSSPLKGIPNYFEKLDNQQKEYVQNLANESNQYFIKLVKNRRNLSEEDLKAVSNGKIFIGTKAMKLKLIDQVGDMNDAIDWLKRKDDLKNLEVKKVNLVKATSKLEKLLDYSSDIKVIFSSIFNKILT